MCDGPFSAPARKARIVDLRYFTGMSVKETADVLGAVRAHPGPALAVHQGVAEEPPRRAGLRAPRAARRPQRGRKGHA